MSFRSPGLDWYEVEGLRKKVKILNQNGWNLLDKLMSSPNEWFTMKDHPAGRIVKLRYDKYSKRIVILKGTEMNGVADIQGLSKYTWEI